MARSSLQQMLVVADPTQTWQWGITVPRIPGLDNSRELSVRAVSSIVPSPTIEPTSWEGNGMKLNYAGRVTYSGTWNASFIEDRTALTRNAFINWIAIVRSWNLNTGTYKSVYAVPVELALYDSMNQVSRSMKLVNCFPTTLGEPALDQTSGILTYDVQFSYDFLEEI
jgi:hypothetical protein